MSYILRKRFCSAHSFLPFLKLKDPRVLKTDVRAASRNESQDLFGAVFKIEDVGKSKKHMAIVFSNHSSESIPRLISLFAHELHHAKGYRKRIELERDFRSLYEFEFVDEALATEIEFETYLQLAKKDPEIFCKWMYVSWGYGNIVIPLSWMMASLDKEMRSGEYMLWHAKEGNFKGYRFLLNSKQSDLSASIKKRLEAPKLKFIKF